MSYFLRFLYTLFIAVDANFKLKSKDRGINDIELSAGGGCFVETEPYEKHLEEYGVKAPDVCLLSLFFPPLTSDLIFDSLTHVIPIMRQLPGQTSPFQVTESTEQVLHYVHGMLLFEVMGSVIWLKERSNYVFLFIYTTIDIGH